MAGGTYDAAPDSTPSANDSGTLTYDANGNVLTKTRVVSGVSYRRTYTYDANGNLLTWSAWVRV